LRGTLIASAVALLDRELGGTFACLRSSCLLYRWLILINITLAIYLRCRRDGLAVMERRHLRRRKGG
jgi:hypothetical protein